MREKILRIIETNSRVGISELAVRLGAEEIDIANELKALEEEGIICGYHTLIDWEKTNLEKVSALIEVKVTPQREQGFDKIAERVRNFEEVNSVYLIAGAYDLLIILQGKTLREISRFVSEKLATIDAVIGTSTNFVLKKYKDHGVNFETVKQDERLAIAP